MSYFKTVAVLGAGTMGSGIAQVAATSGCKVILFDTSKNSLKKGIENITTSLGKLVEKNKISKIESQKIFGRIEVVNSLKKIKHSDLIIEAVVENEKVKKKLFLEVEKIVSPSTVVATNTSSFSIEKLSSSLQQKERFLGMHFFNPPVLMELVEVVYSTETQKKLINKIKETLLLWKKIPVVVKDTPGFIVNRVARSFYLEAMKILEEKIIDSPTIDWAMKEFGKFKMGPFELMDLIGIDVNYAVSKSIYKAFNNNPRFRPSKIQKQMIGKNKLGRKTGIGFYDYKNINNNIAPTKNDEMGRGIFNRIISMLINEAAFALKENIASFKDIELALQKGANYPKGLLAWGKEIGFKNIIDILNKLFKEKNDKRYLACSLLKKL